MPPREIWCLPDRSRLHLIGRWAGVVYDIHGVELADFVDAAAGLAAGLAVGGVVIGWGELAADWLLHPVDVVRWI